jgi:hypothetical protein
MKKLVLALALVAFVASNSYAAAKKSKSASKKEVVSEENGDTKEVVKFERARSSNGKITFGVKYGYAMSKFTGDVLSPNGATVTLSMASTVVESMAVTDVDYFLDWSGTNGTVGGFFVDIPVSKSFSIQPELLYVQKGSRPTLKGEDLLDWYNGTDPDPMPADVVPGAIDINDLSAKLKLSTTYIQVPVLIKANLMPQGNKVVPSIYAGPAIGLLVASKLSVADTLEYDAKDWVSGMDLALVFGVGVKVKNVIFDVRYDMGLTNVFDLSGETVSVNPDLLPTDATVDITLPELSFKNSSLMLTVGYAFN